MALTAQDIIDRVDDLEPNYYSDEYKCSWLDEIELKLWNEIYTTHAGAEDMDAPEEIDPGGAGEHELQVGIPYGRDIYENWVKAKISQANGESGRYNEYITLFLNAWQEFANYWNRKHLPLGNTLIWM